MRERRKMALLHPAIRSFSRTYQKERKIYPLAGTLIKQGRCKAQRICRSTNNYTRNEIYVFKICSTSI